MLSLDTIIEISTYSDDPNYYILNNSIYQYIQQNENCDHWKQKYDHIINNFTFAHLYINLKKDYNWKKKYVFVKRKKNFVDNLFDKSLDSEGETLDNISEIIFEIYKHKYRCISNRPIKFYEFKDHRWISISTEYDLRTKLMDDIIKEYTIIANACFNNDPIKSQNVMKILEKFKNIIFKNQLIMKCSTRFYKISKDFDKLLDSNPNLIGFNNGVYDLEKGCFRKGLPLDYVSISTGYDYKEFNNDQEIKDVEQYFNQTYDEDIKNYLIKFMASCLSGKNQEEYTLLTSLSPNSDFNALNLIETSLGEYVGLLPSTILTRKGSVMSTPELANTKGKRIIFIQPTGNDTININQMRSLRGIGTISTRPLYGMPYSFVPLYKLIQLCYNLPYILPYDKNLKIIPYQSKTDLKLDSDKYKQPFIWLLLNKYYLDYKQNGLKEPSKITQLLTNYIKNNENILKEYINATIEITGKWEDKIRLQSIYEGFKKYIKEIGLILPPERKIVEEHIKTLENLKLVNGIIMGAKEKLH